MTRHAQTVAKERHLRQSPGVLETVMPRCRAVEAEGDRLTAVPKVERGLRPARALPSLV